MHTWTLEYDKETFGTNHKALADEVSLFKEHWKNARVDANTMGKVTISYSCKLTAEAAAKQFQQAVSRHKWWKAA
jgi:hypothetical protein